MFIVWPIAIILGLATVLFGRSTKERAIGGIIYLLGMALTPLLAFI
jgi:hypothetical protein